jgi:hypothetical protein
MSKTSNKRRIKQLSNWFSNELGGKKLKKKRGFFALIRGYADDLDL